MSFKYKLDSISFDFNLYLYDFVLNFVANLFLHIELILLSRKYLKICKKHGNLDLLEVLGE